MSWLQVFNEMDANSNDTGIAAYSVIDIMSMYNVPAFDLLKIDIEGWAGPPTAYRHLCRAA